MPPVYRLVEAAGYALLNFLPFMALALYPFRHRLRFSRAVTGALIAALSVLQVVMGIWAAFYAYGNAGIVTAVSTLSYAAFYFLAIKTAPGKTLFTLLMLSNCANMVVIVSKCIEGQLFPTLALQPYRWSFSLVMLLVDALFGVPLFLYMKRVYTPAVEREPSGVEWRYLWLVPATFYLVWYFVLYDSETHSTLEIALRPDYAAFLVLINVGAGLIYYVVARLILEQIANIRLERERHRLAMQAVQYDNLQEKIAEARRAKHDVRHHVSLMQDYVRRGAYEELREYLDQYQQSLPEDSLGTFCENAAVNAVLGYFAQQAKAAGIVFQAEAVVPQEIGVAETDLSVLFGNLLENALDACAAEHGDDRRIVLHASADRFSLCLTVDNTFTGKLRRADEGVYLSTKHGGAGVGTESVRAIAEKYSGVCRFEQDGRMFYASVMLNM